MDALTGCTVDILTLDERRLSIPINDVITPQYQKKVDGEGMPISKRPGAKGDLYIKFDVRGGGACKRLRAVCCLPSDRALLGRCNVV